MQKYVEQLLADFEASKLNLPKPLDYSLLYPDHPAANSDMAYVIEWENAPEQTMSELFDISWERLPPVEKLTEEQIVLLLNGMIELWETYSFLPHDAHNDDLPAHLRYKAMANYWQKATVCYSSEGVSDIFSLCEYHVETCIWGNEFCTCKDLDDDMDAFEADLKQNPDRLPF
jgi:hypothetical protein